MHKFDKDLLLEDYEEDRDILDKLIKDFSIKSLQLLNMIDKSFISAEMEQMAKELHSLRGSTSIFYPDEEIIGLIESVEYSYNELSDEEIKSRILEIKKIISDLVAQLQVI
ncbi:MAG: hypothetical protein H6622_13765 [Halobacteriovoraceae bacterium]|nr:hypothetical protein [Halobacteriovoraceae bacterium]